MQGTHLKPLNFIEFSKAECKPLTIFEMCPYMYALEAFQKSLESPSHFSKGNGEPN